jgi:hypothetical protein
LFSEFLRRSWSVGGIENKAVSADETKAEEITSRNITTQINIFPKGKEIRRGRKYNKRPE